MKNKSKDQIFLVQGLLATKITITSFQLSLLDFQSLRKHFYSYSTPTVSIHQFTRNEVFPELLFVLRAVIKSLVF